jgi:hypothetical protein
MGLEAAVANLVKALETLRDSVSAVQMCAVEDRPKRGDCVLIDLIEAAAEDIKANLRDARKAAARASKALGPPPDLDRLRLGLASCQKHYTEAAQGFASQLSSYERLHDLNSLGRDRRGEWQSWTAEMTRFIERCKLPLQEVGQTLFVCWQEIAERASAGGTSVRSVGVGLLQVGPVSHSVASDDPDGPRVSR